MKMLLFATTTFLAALFTQSRSHLDHLEPTHQLLNSSIEQTFNIVEIDYSKDPSIQGTEFISLQDALETFGSPQQ